MALVCFGVCYGVGKGIVSLLPVWLLGVLLAVLPVDTTAWMCLLAFVLYCPFFAAVSREGITGAFPPDYALGLATFALLYVLLGALRPATGGWYERPSRTLAGFSYTLYLVHVPMLMLLTALLAGESRWLPDAKHIAVAMTVLTL